MRFLSSYHMVIHHLMIWYETTRCLNYVIKHKLNRQICESRKFDKKFYNGWCDRLCERVILEINLNKNLSTQLLQKSLWNFVYISCSIALCKPFFNFFYHCSLLTSAPIAQHKYICQKFLCINWFTFMVFPRYLRFIYLFSHCNYQIIKKN